MSFMCGIADEKICRDWENSIALHIQWHIPIEFSWLLN
jgi:hypothetical protein